MNLERLYRVLLGPYTTEKTVDAAERNRQSAFRVIKNATKPEIKKAVEMLFDVTVLRVHVCNMPGKKKRSGSQNDWKKAWVSLPKGQDIDFTRLAN